MGIYIKALLLIFLAEMGDKTQLMAMAFATRYKVRDIVIGIALGAFVNHGLAIALGSILQRVIPFEVIYLVAGVIFILFGLLSLSIDDETVEAPTSKYGPILTVGAAFFIGELGDKTQLTALTLSTSYGHPAIILMGTVSGMVLTGLLAIWVGIKLGSKVPELQLKVGAALVFMIFGVEKLMATHYFNQYISYFMMSIAVAVVIFAYRTRQMILLNRTLQTGFSTLAERLKKHFEILKKGVDTLCLGPTVCQTCDGTSCVVGMLKVLIQKAIENDYDENAIEQFEVENLLIKNYNRVQIEKLIAYMDDEMIRDREIGSNPFVVKVRELLLKAQEEKE
ncbi:MAG: TMEM165/GDT1 family protein [Clostridia bacterium]|nr:TMEM165/GDT1 family protein [Clostridia bacterium]